MFSEYKQAKYTLQIQSFVKLWVGKMAILHWLDIEMDWYYKDKMLPFISVAITELILGVSRFSCNNNARCFVCYETD